MLKPSRRLFVSTGAFAPRVLAINCAAGRDRTGTFSAQAKLLE
jgi:hypothetical protein